MEPAINAQGFLLPCCWCDNPKTLNHKTFKKLIKDKFHLDNVEQISDFNQILSWG